MIAPAERRGLRLSAVLQHPSLSDVERVAGATDPVVATIGATHAAELAGMLASVPSDVVVLLDETVQTDWRFDAALRRAADAQVAVLVLHRTSVVTAATRALADRLDVVLLACANPWATSLALRDRLTGGDDALIRMMTALIEAVQQAGPDVADVLHAAGRHLGRTILHVDTAGRVLAPLDGTASVPRPTDARASLSGVLIEDIDDGVLASVPVQSGVIAPSWLRVSLPAAAASEVAAVRLALPAIALAVGHRLSVRRVIDEREARWRTALIGELTEAGEAPSASTLRRALELGWRVEGWHIGIRVVTRADVDIVAMRYEIVEALGGEGLDADVVEQSDGWAAWLTFELQPTLAEVTAAAQAVRRAQLRWNEHFPTHVGIGRVLHGPSGITASLSEAGDAARLAGSRPQSGHFLHVDRLGLAQLLLAWTQTDTFQPAALELLAPLREQTTGDLLRTLASYLDAESSIVETASVLGIHRNTVAERIQRIQRILAVDLQDAETRLALHLACRTVLASTDG
ncbi:PucR family transcriptional regulator [Microbacterium saperdae]|uniref:PucR-like helix-turn-helix protein n=1 Tax=Microbacterium saperdae TaxID=69368 RepID=A0A543BI07_9MICO|nr:helix-turn-helix domain-containing protein [Microbacterium saperdae]TQL84482.1 PucR-like helix-turn-helix protein [Microbacterium saperdae]GGM60634.1 hypothetical protein GCM10010489_35240 [Microbacterium saperdae]